MSKYKKSGISLIVLVITIIIMIILAAAVVISLQNTGIIGAAKSAVCKTNIKEAQNLAVLKWSELYIKGERDLGKIKEEIIKEFNSNKLNADDYEIEVTTGGVEVTAKAGCIDVSGGVTEPDDDNSASTSEWVYAYTYTAADGWSQKLTNEGTDVTGDIVAKFYETGEILPQVSTQGVTGYVTLSYLPEGKGYKMVIDGSGVLDVTSTTNRAWFGEVADYEGYGSYLGGYVTDIELSEGITEIGGNTFYGFVNLRNINFPSGLTKIEYNAFKEAKLSEVVLPDTVMMLGNSVFENNTKLKKVVLPKTMDNGMGSSCFSGCTSLENVELPTNLWGVPSGTFKNCTSLKSIKITTTRGTFSVSGFEGCVNLANIELPSVVNEIGGNAFKGCTSIGFEKIPTTLVKVGDNAFEGCTKFTEVVVPTTWRIIGENVFKDCTNITKVTIESRESGASNKFVGMFIGCTNLVDVNYADNVQFGSSMFKNCTSLKSIELPPYQWRITAYMFHGCTSLESVVIPETVDSIWQYAFMGCTSLKSVVVPESVGVFKDQVFSYCTNLESVTILCSSLWFDGVCSFMDCTNLKTINFAGTEDEWKSLTNLSSQRIPTATVINYGYVNE